MRLPQLLGLAFLAGLALLNLYFRRKRDFSRLLFLGLNAVFLPLMLFIVFFDSIKAATQASGVDLFNVFVMLVVALVLALTLFVFHIYARVKASERKIADIVHDSAMRRYKE